MGKIGYLNYLQAKDESVATKEENNEVLATYKDEYINLADVLDLPNNTVVTSLAGDNFKVIDGALVPIDDNVDTQLNTYWLKEKFKVIKWVNISFDKLLETIKEGTEYLNVSNTFDNNTVSGSIEEVIRKLTLLYKDAIFIHALSEGKWSIQY